MMDQQVAKTAWNEEERLAVLDSYRVLDTPAERSFDDVVRLTAQLLQAPIAAVNLIARGRQWFKSEVGLGVREMPLDDSICRHALLEEDRMVVCDTLLDRRFSGNPLVTGGPELRFYAGELLKTPDGLPLGTLCVLDTRPRPDGITEQQAFALQTLARQIMTQLELRKQTHEQARLLEENKRTAAELRRERDRAYQLFQGMDEGYVFLDEQFRIREISPGGLRMDGRTEQELVGRTHWEAWPGSEHLAVADAIRHAMAEREPVNVEQLYVFPDGRRFWLDMRAFPAEGGLAMFYRDITARKDAEHKLRETADRLEFTLEAAGIGDWDLDLTNDSSYRSLRHDRCFGYSEPIPEWGFQTFIQHVHPDDREHVRQQFETSLAELADWHFECRVVWPDRTVHWIAAHGSIYDVDAQPTKMSGIVYDISARKDAEAALRHSEHLAREAARVAEQERQRLDAVLQAAPVGILVTDVSGRIVHVNAENRRLWGPHPLAERIGDFADWHAWWADGSARTGQRLAPEDWAMARALWGDAAPRQIIEIEPFDAPGVRRIILNSGAPIKDPQGTVVGAVVAQMDITDRVKAERALREADQRKDEFLAMLAHELRNPLAPITSAAHILSSDRLDPQPARLMASVISRQARHMTALVDDLLDVSRVTRGLVKLDKQLVDAKAVIADAVEQVRPLIEKHGHDLSVHLSPEPGLVQGDRKRLVQIVANLLNNAAKYTPDGGAIHVALDVGPDVVTIKVADDGVGMSRELIECAFELFTQAERSPDRSQGGLGIGLALVRSLAQLHGGGVVAHSDGPGTGSTFEVTLPRSAAGGGRQAGPAGDDPGRPVTRLRVLLVDDNEDAADTLGLYLETCGHEVAISHLPSDALEQAATFRPDVAVLDIGLPEMDGYELARRLRATPTTAGAVLIALTGYGQERDRAEAMAAGFDYHLVKPVDLGRLEQLLSDVSHHRRRDS